MLLLSLLACTLRQAFLLTLVSLALLYPVATLGQDQQLGHCHCCYRPSCVCYPCATETKCSIKNACDDANTLWKQVNSKLVDPKGTGLPDGFIPPFDRLYGDDLLCRNNPSSKIPPDIGNTLADIRQEAGIDHPGAAVDRPALRKIRDDLAQLNNELHCKEGCDNDQIKRLQARMKALKEAWDAFAKQYSEDEKRLTKSGIRYMAYGAR